MINELVYWDDGTCRAGTIIGSEDNYWKIKGINEKEYLVEKWRSLTKM